MKHEIPEKHRAVAHAWVDGATIETLGIDNIWRVHPYPSFNDKAQYRIKREMVKKYRWLLMRTRFDLMRVAATTDDFVVTTDWFSEEEVYKVWPGYVAFKVIQKVEGTEKIVEE